MSWRIALAALVPLGIACTDGTTPPLAHPDALRTNTALLPVDPSITIRVLPNLDGNNVTVTSFNRYDEVAGYTTTGSTMNVFRSRHAIQFFTPPAGFQTGNFFPLDVGINASGRVVSSIQNDTAYRAFIWWHNGGTTLLQPTYHAFEGSGPLGCSASAITDSDYVVGNCIPNSNQFIAEWRPDGTIIKDECCGNALAISENHHIAGYTILFNPPQAFVWNPGDTNYTILGVLGGHPEVSEGLGVNTHGWVAGWAAPTVITQTQAILWVPGQPQRILSHYGQAAGIDNWGNVVGFHQDTVGAPMQAFLWNFATGAHFLPGLPGGSQTAAVAINNVNPEILGWAIDVHGTKHAVIWTFKRS